MHRKLLLPDEPAEGLRSVPAPPVPAARTAPDNTAAQAGQPEPAGADGRAA
jgi:hypothetical protein